MVGKMALFPQVPGLLLKKKKKISAQNGLWGQIERDCQCIPIVHVLSLKKKSTTKNLYAFYERLLLILVLRFPLDFQEWK